MIFAEIPFPQTLAEFWAQFIGDGASAHPIIQFIKYAFAGGIATVVHILTFYTCCWKLFPSLTQNDIVVRVLKAKVIELPAEARARNAVYSNIVAFFASNIVCYIINRIFVFKPGEHNVVVEFLLFLAVSAIAIFLGTAIMRWLIKHFNMQTTFAFVANLVTSLMLNYVLRKFFIFAG
ncbi:MAG: GtrA family protein [Kiritimatiellae bacterium]|nr:GtrA family protein [Kiritimatiellia bacterium]